jgi:uncharacterized membrane protein HdeD (DUF308 family)
LSGSAFFLKYGRCSATAGKATFVVNPWRSGLRLRPLLANFIGGFWIAGSLLTVRWGLAHKRSRLITMLIGITGALAGLAMAGRSVVDNWITEDALFLMLGIVAVLTGLLHITGHLRVKQHGGRERTRSGMLLGFFEIVLGLVVILTPWQERFLINIVLIAWALVGGVVLLFDALAMRREANETEKLTDEPDA